MALTQAQIAILEEETASQALTPKQRAILEEEQKKPEKQNLRDYNPLYGSKAPFSIPNVVGAAVEPGLSLGTGIAAYPAGIMAAIGSHWKELAGAETAGPEANRNTVMEALTYQPRTQAGKKGSEYLQNVLTLGGAIPEAAKWTNEQVGGGVYGAVNEEFINLIPALLGARAMPKGNILPKGVRETVAKPIEYAGDVAGRGKQIVSNALTTRFNKGQMDNMLGQIANEAAGPRVRDVLSELERAPEGVTAAQAAVPAGSYEFSALQKLGKDRMPSEYGAIERQQTLGRRKAIQEDIARTPEELALAKEQLAAESAKQYETSRNQPVDPRSNKGMLIDAMLKAEQKAKTAEQSKISALQDTGRFQTLEGNQAARALRQPPKIGPVTEALTGQRAPTSAQMGDIPGQPRIPPRYTSQNAVAKEAGKAAVETKDIANIRRTQEATHTGISETMMLNTIGEEGAALSKFMDRPSIKAAVRRAKLAAQETGTYWPKTPNDKFTVGNLQRIKREVADTVAESAKQGRIGKTTKAERTGTVAEFTDWLRKKSPDFAKAEDFFAENIQPINQMKVGQEILKKMDDNLGVTERPAGFANVIEGAEKLTKGQTGRAIPLKDVLTEKQMNTLGDVKGQYIRDAELKKMSAGGVKKLNEIIGNVFDLPTFGILERTIVIINGIIKRVEGRNTTAAIDRMSELGMQPRELAKYMRAALPKEKAILEKHMNAKTKAAVAALIADTEAGEQ